MKIAVYENIVLLLYPFVAGLCSNALAFANANAAFAFALAFDFPAVAAFALEFAFDSPAIALTFDSNAFDWNQMRCESNAEQMRIKSK